MMLYVTKMQGDCRVLQSRKDSFLYFNNKQPFCHSEARCLKEEVAQRLYYYYFIQAGMLDLQLNYTL